MTRSRALPLLALLLLAALAPSVAGIEAGAKGHLLLIGGGDKPPEVMRKFADGRDDEVARLLLQESRNPGVPVDLLRRLRRPHAPFVDGPPLVPPRRLRREGPRKKRDAEERDRGQA